MTLKRIHQAPLLLIAAITAIACLLMVAPATAASLPKAPVELDCATILDDLKSNRVMLAVVFGQSNSANFGLTQKSSGHNVYSFYKGKCYLAADPLPGASGHGGSIWTRLGDMVINSSLYDKVVFVSVGENRTTVADWKPGGRAHHRLVSGLRGALAMGFDITHLIWMQGEQDAINNTQTKDYIAAFEETLTALRRGGIKAPVLVSLTSICGAFESAKVRQAQRELVKKHPGVFPGPDTDALGRKYRFDNCHFNSEGLEAAATAWLNAIGALEPETSGQ